MAVIVDAVERVSSRRLRSEVGFDVCEPALEAAFPVLAMPPLIANTDAAAAIVLARLISRMRSGLAAAQRRLQTIHVPVEVHRPTT